MELARVGRPVIRCHATLTYPLPNGYWTMITCPLEKDHIGLHADENYYPFFTDEDIAWFETQYRLCVAT